MQTMGHLLRFLRVAKPIIIGGASVLAMNLAFAQAPVMAAPKPAPSPSPASTSATNSGCEAQAASKKLTGAAKSTFLKKCESAHGTKKTLNKQQQKMVSCNKDAGQKKLKGAERKKFMSSCLKG
jgi:psiF repeat